MFLSATDLNDDGTFTARFGVFLCIPKNKNEFRIALLWRHETTTLQDASIQFGRILYAIQLCSYLRESNDLDKKKINYTYLGPNCCKIGKLVRLITIHNLSGSDYRFFLNAPTGYFLLFLADEMLVAVPLL